MHKKYFPPFERVCPVCSKMITHKSRRILLMQLKKNLPCLNCTQKNRLGNYADACLQCGKEVIFKSNAARKSAATVGIVCEGCHKSNLTRKCPECAKVLIYKYIGRFNAAVIKNSLCNSCFAKRNAQVINANGGYKGVRQSVYKTWLKKYGQVEADKRYKTYRDKASKRFSGKNNPMYGKPAPSGSGNGWQGWYKNIFFRSLLELSYMISLDKEGKEWKTAETREFAINYIDPISGSERTYVPDFLVENKWLIEIKPLRLQNSKIVRAKAEAAIKFANSKGLQYSLLSAPSLTDLELKSLYNSKTIKFMDRYEKKYQERYANLTNGEKNGK